jgi:hypothetical protein
VWGGKAGAKLGMHACMGCHASMYSLMYSLMYSMLYSLTHHTHTHTHTDTHTHHTHTHRLRGAPGPFITLHNVRHLFITDRRDDPTAPGPSTASAAAAMLHSPAQWGAVYDKRAQRRRMTEAVEGMEAYRAAKLPKTQLAKMMPPPPHTHNTQPSSPPQQLRCGGGGVGGGWVWWFYLVCFAGCVRCV